MFWQYKVLCAHSLILLQVIEIDIKVIYYILLIFLTLNSVLDLRQVVKRICYFSILWHELAICKQKKKRIACPTNFLSWCKQLNFNTKHDWNLDIYWVIFPYFSIFHSYWGTPSSLYLYFSHLLNTLHSPPSPIRAWSLILLYW